MILAALLTAESTYYVYFIQRHASISDEDYWLII